MKKERNENLRNQLPKPEQHTLGMVTITSASQHLYPHLSHGFHPFYEPQAWKCARPDRVCVCWLGCAAAIAATLPKGLPYASPSHFLPPFGSVPFPSFPLFLSLFIVSILIKIKTLLEMYGDEDLEKWLADSMWKEEAGHSGVGLHSQQWGNRWWVSGHPAQLNQKALGKMKNPTSKKKRWEVPKDMCFMCLHAYAPLQARTHKHTWNINTLYNDICLDKSCQLPWQRILFAVGFIIGQ